MWKDDKKQKSSLSTPSIATTSILVRKKPIPSQSFQNSNVSNDFEFQKQQPSSNKENYNDLQSPLSYLYSKEDMRISKLLRRLTAENNASLAIDLCNKLELAALDPQNASYITRSFDLLAESFIYILREGPVDCLFHVAKVFGTLGYVIRFDFPVYKDWIIKNYKSNKKLQKHLMVAFRTTIVLDSETLDLTNYSDRVLTLLKSYLENSENTETFKQISSTIAAFSRNYKRSFERHFTDIVDMIVGWHLECGQSLELKDHCSVILQHFSNFFLKNLDFTLSLVSQFLEDIQSFSSDNENEDPDPETITLGSYIGAFNSIVKCMVNGRNEVIAFTLDNKTFNDSLHIIIEIVLKNLKESPKEETIFAVNEFVVLAVNNSAQITIEKITELIELELINLKDYEMNTTLSIMYMIHSTVARYSGEMPTDLITVFCSNEDIKSLIYSNQPKISKIAIKIYQKILSIKSVKILQEMYKYIREDSQKVMQLFSSKDDIPNLTVKQGEYLLNFYLTSLSTLATETSSIIAMYALNPSLLDWLINDLRPADMKIWKNHKLLQNMILILLETHCRRNRQYILSSNLFKKDEVKVYEENNVKAMNFEKILKFLRTILKQEKLSNDNFNILLKWVKDILFDCEQYSDIITSNEDFQTICLSLCSVDNDRSGILIADCLDILLKYGDLGIDIYSKITEMCLSKMCCVQTDVRDCYTRLYGKIPLEMTLNMKCANGEKSVNIMQWNSLKPQTGDPIIKDENFKDIMKNLQPESLDESLLTYIDEFLFKIYQQTQKIHKLNNKPSILKDNLKVLVPCVQFELAEYCVRNKLRTSLGKPQETFVKIEEIVKSYARMLTNKPKDEGRESVNKLILKHKHAKFLLGFLEYLEKCIYNAAEGTAFALPQHEKAAKNFFKLNMPTCQEWFNRIRPATNIVALHSMETGMVIRYSEIMLEQLFLSKNFSDGMLDHILITYSDALVREKDYESLQGLYAYVKQKTGKKIFWLKSLADKSNDHFEKSAESLKTLISSTEDKNIKEYLLEHYTESIFNTFQVDKLKEVSEFSENLFFNEEIANLGDWKAIVNGAEEACSFSFQSLVNKADSSLMNFLLTDVIPSEQDVLSDCSRIINIGLQESVLTNSKEFYKELVLLNFVSLMVGEGFDQLNFSSEDNYESKTYLNLLKWFSAFTNRSYFENINQKKSQLFLKIASKAREEENLQLSSTYLNKFLEINSDPNDFQNIALKHDMFKSFCEVVKLNYKRNPQNPMESIDLAAKNILLLIENDSQKNEQTLVECSKMCINISEWSSGKLEVGSSSWITKLLPHLEKIPIDNESSYAIPANEMIVGKILQKSVNQTPHIAETWSAFGSWCYRWGKKIVESSSGNTSINYLAKEVHNIGIQIPNASAADLEEVIGILNKQQQVYFSSYEDDENMTEEVKPEVYIEQLEEKLSEHRILSTVPKDTIEKIINIWKHANKGIYAYYETAADCYFKYLSLMSSSQGSGSSGVVMATLRLLRLIVKHAIGLQEVIENGLATTPTKPWEVIIPQLFSRLNHHEVYVRKRISELLCRIAEDSPHLITFPAVAGTVNDDSTHKGVELANGLKTDHGLSLCIKSLLSTLSLQTPETVEQVKIFIKELRRITILWEEFWMHSLAQLYNEYSQIFNDFVEATKRYKSSVKEKDLLNKKYDIITKYIVNDIEELTKVTTKAVAITNHERSFQIKYTKVIESTIEDLKKPLNLSKPNESWMKLKQLYNLFQQKMQKMSGTVLKMSDISPVLANMKNTAISMPGVYSNEFNSIFIVSVEQNVFTLPTKTKPKKLAFYGSNGKKYTYLFKGLEDLHLDERIMQFLSISNTMMVNPRYKAQNYSVIPLGTRSGLISWVDGVTPLFSIYKKWQQRVSVNTPTPRPSELFFKKLTPLLTEKNMEVTDNRKNWPTEVLRKVLDELTAETPNYLLSREIWCYSLNCSAWRQAVKNFANSMAVMSVIGYVIGLGDRHLDNMLVKLSTGELVHIDYNVCFEKGKTLRVPEKVPFRMTQNLLNALGVTGVEGIFRLTCEYVLKTLRKERETLLTLLEAFVYDPLVDWAVNEDGVSNTNRITKAVQAANEILAIGGIDETKSNISIDPKLRKIQNIKQITDSIKAKSSEFKPEWRAFAKEYIELFQSIQSSIDEYIAIEDIISLKEQESEILKKQIDYVDVPMEMIDSHHPLKSLPGRYKTYKDAHDSYNKCSITVNSKIQHLEAKLSNFDKITKSSYINLKSFLERMAIGGKIDERDDIKAVLSKSEKRASYERFIGNSERIVNIQMQSLPLIQNFLNDMNDYFDTIEYCSSQTLADRRYKKYLSWLQNPEVEFDIKDDLDCGQVKQSTFETYLMALETVSKNVDKKILEGEKCEKDISIKETSTVELRSTIVNFYQTNPQETKHAALSILQIINSFMNTNIYEKCLNNLYTSIVITQLFVQLFNMKDIFHTIDLLNVFQDISKFFLNFDVDIFYPLIQILFKTEKRDQKLNSSDTNVQNLNIIMDKYFDNFISQITKYSFLTNRPEIVSILQREKTSALMEIWKTGHEIMNSLTFKKTSSVFETEKLLNPVKHFLVETVVNGFLIDIIVRNESAFGAALNLTGYEDSSEILSVMDLFTKELKVTNESVYLIKRKPQFILQKTIMGSVIKSFMWQNHPTLKDKFVSKLNENKAMIQSTSEKLYEILNQQQSYVEDLHRELLIQQSFVPFFQNELELIQNFGYQLTSCLNFSEQLIQYELTNDRVFEEERTFVLLVEEFHTASHNKEWALNSDLLLEEEISICELLNPEDSVDKNWLNSIMILLDESYCEVQDFLYDAQAKKEKICTSLYPAGQKVQRNPNTKIRNEIRALSKLINKLDENVFTQILSPKQLQTHFKHYCNDMRDLESIIICRTYQENSMEIHKFYRLVSNLLSNLQRINREVEELTKAEKYDVDYIDSMNNENLPVEDTKDFKKGEQKNSYAVSVWKKIRMKLEGRDPDIHHRQTVVEQVDWIIKEATNPDNLAVLYEGWTPWV